MRPTTRPFCATLGKLENTFFYFFLLFSLFCKKVKEVKKKYFQVFLMHSPHINIPSYYRTTCLVSDLTGIELVIHHMCINSCIVYTGPFLDLEACPLCSELRYDQFKLRSSGGKKKTACQEFHTIPVGPQLQVLYREPESTVNAHYLHEERERVLLDINRNGYLDRYSDVLHGTDLIEAF